MLIDAGFVAKRANTPEQVALLNSLPPNQFVQQTVNGKATYLYADPARATAFMSEVRVHSRASKACRTSCTT
jgi:hypothetical protein